ncbi:MAG: hypothetical protein KF812_04820 [Fimbriimonadaceae bacterium]|nr:hypothetical protein [Fimbriimonadaceae bacterium]
MKKTYLLVLAGLVIVGCGGTDGSGLTGGSTAGTTSGSTSGTTSGRAIPDSKLTNVAEFQFLYLSGQGRRATDSIVATIRNGQIQNSASDYFPTTQQGTGTGIRVQLDGYTLNSLNLNDRVESNVAAKTYSQYPLQISQFERTTDTGSQVLFSGDFTVNPPIPINAKLLPGRQTTLQMKLNDAMFDIQTVGGNTTIDFDEIQFAQENYNVVDQRVNGILSDFVSFDIRGLAAADRPQLLSGARAERVMFSGDAVAMTVGSNTNGSLEVLPPTTDIQTRFAGIFRLPGNIAGRPTPGTYVVTEPDPRVPTDPTAALLTAMQGIWRNHTEVLDYTNIQNGFSMVVIPSHEDKFPTPDGEDGLQVLIYNQSGGNITAMYQGRIRFTSSSAGVLEAWSIDQVDTAGSNNPAIGSVNNFELKNGRVSAGDFTISVVPTGWAFPVQGSFRVLR